MIAPPQHPGSSRRLAGRAVLILWLGLAFGGSTPASDSYVGRPVAEVLEELRAGGLPLVYSSSLVPAELPVMAQPTATLPLDVARQIIAPHGLAVRARDGVYVVVRQESQTPPAEAHEGLMEDSDVPVKFGPADIEIVAVSASRYLLLGASQFFVDQRAIQALPDLGEDPLRAAHRLPGAAASGLSSKTHFRGGEHDETAIYLNGLQLLEPFHIRDYHSIFSSIDARAITGVEAYTGGFPARYGDHMSGVLALQSQRAEEPRHTELGLSVYNTSILHSGHSADERWDWLVSARDSNLDLVLNPDLGEPDYFDVFAQVGHRVSDNTRLTFNALYADDGVTVITENNPEELERSDSDTRNSHAWITLENDWMADLGSVTALSLRSLENLRIAEANDPEKMIARVRDHRTSDDWGIRQDWLWTGWAGHELRFGWEYRDLEADYDYEGAAQYEGFLAELPDLESPRQHLIRASPRGRSLALFASDRWALSESTRLEAGLRWDQQTWSDPDFDGQFSPRISLLRRLDENSDFRFTWGRYYQSQAIHALQVEDGVDQFFAPQRSEHWIAGYRRNLQGGYRLRAELFLKNYEHLKPRFENLFDPLALIPEMAPDRVRLSPASAQSKGIELSLEFRSGGPFEGWVSYVLSRATDRIDGVNQARSWDQRHALQAGVSWRSEPWEIGLAVNAHSGWPTTPLAAVFDPEEEAFSPVPGARNSEDLGSFFTLDFRVSRKFAVRKGRLSAFLEVSNATNRDNPCCIDYDIDDEVEPAVVDRSVDFWVPIIPAIGLLWEF